MMMDDVPFPMKSIGNMHLPPRSRPSGGYRDGCWYPRGRIKFRSGPFQRSLAWNVISCEMWGRFHNCDIPKGKIRKSQDRCCLECDGARLTVGARKTLKQQTSSDCTAQRLSYSDATYVLKIRPLHWHEGQTRCRTAVPAPPDLQHSVR